MDTILQLIVGAAALPLLILGTRSMFKPRGMGQAFAIQPQGAPGLSTIRSLAGGLFFASVTMLALGLSTGDTTWFLAVAVIMGAVVVGRLVGLATDGVNKAVLPPLVVEIVIGSALVAAHLGLGA